MAAESPELRAIRRALAASARPAAARALSKFFKTGPGQYAEGDLFIGVAVPELRRLARASDSWAEADILSLLRSPIHEERLLALLGMVRRYDRNEADRAALVATFLREKKFINNWDLVDSSAPYLLGPWLLTRDRSVLRRLAGSKNLWERRIAILATFPFIRVNDFTSTLALAEALLADGHDLIHKAVGWMLREIGNRDEPTLRTFLDAHAPAMPRTMLRYAIEKFPPADRARYLALPRASRPATVFKKKRTPDPRVR